MSAVVCHLPYSHLGGINIPRTHKPCNHLGGIDTRGLYYTYSHPGIDTRGVYYAYSHPGGKQTANKPHRGFTVTVKQRRWIFRKRISIGKLPFLQYFAAFAAERLSAQLAI